MSPCQSLVRRVALLHPFCAAVAPILFLGAANSDQITPEALYAPLGVSLAASGVLYAGLWLLRRDARRAAAITTLAIVLFFGYGHVFEAIDAAGWPASRQGLDWVLGSVSLLLFLPAAMFLWRTPRSLLKLTQFLSLTATLVLAISAQHVVQERANLRQTRRRMAAENRKAASMAKPASTGRIAVPTGRPIPVPERVPPLDQDSPQHPDIYYIILDGYAREDMLREVYGHDNSEFIEALRQRGFYVADASCANYPMTFLSLASSLNMRYLNEDTERLGRASLLYWPIYDLIKDNTVGRYLQAKGYRYVHVASNYGATERSCIADVTYSPVHPILQQEFIGVLLRTTLLHGLVPNVAHTHLHAFRRLEEIPRMTGPTFAFSHLVLPHNPYVFDRDGNIQEDIPLGMQFERCGKTGGWKNLKGYVDQLVYTNRRTLEVIDAILERSPVPPVIIVQADHGTASRKSDEISVHRQPDFIRERMPILNAYYVPNACRKQLYSQISPVNTFRLLFNALFGETFERLPDRHYFAWYGQPYKLQDVTELVGGRSRAALAATKHDENLAR